MFGEIVNNGVTTCQRLEGKRQVYKLVQWRVKGGDEWCEGQRRSETQRSKNSVVREIVLWNRSM